jgi:hypothetical protein
MSEYDYRYQEPTGPSVDLLPEGQYRYLVTGLISEAYTNNGGNFVLPVKLAVGPDKLSIWDWPSAGLTKAGDPYDNIAAFLKSCGKNPKPGERPDLSEQNLKGARGMCQIKIEIAGAGTMKGKEVNKVHYYIWNQGTPGAAAPVVSQQQPEPDDIPF